MTGYPSIIAVRLPDCIGTAAYFLTSRRVAKVNFKHLYYFWMTANTGGVLRASARLHITPQTLSGQIKQLEARLGRRLFERDGRTVRLTEAGKVAAGYAAQIFELGQRLEASLKGDVALSPPAEFRVGIDQSMPTPIASRLLQSAAASTRIIGRRGDLATLSAELEARNLDIVLANAPAFNRTNETIVSHRLGSSKLAMFAARSIRETVNAPFPFCLEGMPLLLPGLESRVGEGLQAWLDRKQLSPRIVGEFNDWALTLSFGEGGRGVFAAPAALEDDLSRQYDLRPLGLVDEVAEEFYAILNAHGGCNGWTMQIVAAAPNLLRLDAACQRNDVLEEMV
jgi:LysR family transcriptional activator of nhaA